MSGLRILFSTVSYTHFSFPDAPMMNSTADKVAIDINQSAILICQAHSVPATTFQWFNGSTLMTSGGRIHITSTEIPGASHPYLTSLNISDVTLYDLGSYRCVGKNKIGTSHVNIHLTVKSEYIHGMAGLPTHVI